MHIQQLRRQRGWSQQQLAELSGLSVRTIQRIENGHPPSTETLKALASVFDIHFQQLQPQTLSAAKTSSVEPETPALALSQVRQVQHLYKHAVIYAAVITLLATINVMTRPQFLWCLYPTAGWGLVLLMRAATAWNWLPVTRLEEAQQQARRRIDQPR